MAESNEFDLSLVRQNMLTKPGYVPYCGKYDCKCRWPRTKFNGAQFVCDCGWESGLEPEFIERYKQAQAKFKELASNGRD